MAPTTDETAENVAKAKAALDLAESEHTAATAAAAGPREPNVILADFMDQLVGRLGNRRDLRALVNEYKAAIAPELPAKAA